MRSYLSTHWLWAARHFVRETESIERAGNRTPAFDLRHRALVLAAITGSVSFLEATVNELFEDAVDGHGVRGDGYLAPLAPGVVVLMASHWVGLAHGRAMSVLDKYELLARCAGVPALDLGARPAQDVAALVRLRNALIHFLPDDTAADLEHHLQRSLRGRFRTNGLMSGMGNPWWPDHCLGAGCAAWAVQSGVAFTDNVMARIGIVPNYARHRGTPWFEGPEDPAAQP
jgi:hypothetical protein